MTTDELIDWAQFWCLEPVNATRSSFEVARRVYDEIDDRLGDAAEKDETSTREFWLEMARGLAKLGWTISEFEKTRWPVKHAISGAVLIRSGF